MRSIARIYDFFRICHRYQGTKTAVQENQTQHVGNTSLYTEAPGQSFLPLSLWLVAMFSVASVRCSLFSLNSNREQPLVPASLSKTLRSLNLEPYQISRPSYRRLNATSASLVCIFLTSSLFPCTKDFKNLTAQPRITRRYYFFH